MLSEFIIKLQSPTSVAITASFAKAYSSKEIGNPSDLDDKTPISHCERICLISGQLPYEYIWFSGTEDMGR